MKRTINENKAIRIINYGFITTFCNMFIWGSAIRYNITILAIVSMILFFVGIFLLSYGGYSLGWEYKRISMEEDE